MTDTPVQSLGLLAGLAFLVLAPPASMPTPPPATPVPRAPDAQILVVVARADGPLTDLTLDEVRRLFRGDPVHEPGGVRLVPLNQLPGTSERIAFDRVALGMSPDDVARFWIDRKIRGQGAAPRGFASSSVIQKLVARVPGAIGYVRLDRLEAGVRPVRIDGRGPRDVGYALVTPTGGGS